MSEYHSSPTPNSPILLNLEFSLDFLPSLTQVWRFLTDRLEFSCKTADMTAFKSLKNCPLKSENICLRNPF